jgi:hypothetical protein
MIPEHSDTNPMPEGEALSATLFQAGQVVSKGKATREEKCVYFQTSPPIQTRPASLLSPITLKLSCSDVEVTLRMERDWADHLNCCHEWYFEIVDV